MNVARHSPVFSIAAVNPIIIQPETREECDFLFATLRAIADNPTNTVLKKSKLGANFQSIKSLQDTLKRLPQADRNAFIAEATDNIRAKVLGVPVVRSISPVIGQNVQLEQSSQDSSEGKIARSRSPSPHGRMNGMDRDATRLELALARAVNLILMSCTDLRDIRAYQEAFRAFDAIDRNVPVESKSRSSHCGEPILGFPGMVRMPPLTARSIQAAIQFEIEAASERLTEEERLTFKEDVIKEVKKHMILGMAHHLSPNEIFSGWFLATVNEESDLICECFGRAFFDANPSPELVIQMYSYRRINLLPFRADLNKYQEYLGPRFGRVLFEG